MIGFYNYTVILTYLGMASSAMGIFLSIEGHFTSAIICLMISGVCDMFDGSIARTRQRTATEKRFGIQIDSLCDLVCFGVFPAVFAYNYGLRQGLFRYVLVLFILAAVIRLAYYNVTEECRQEITDEKRKTYQGLPVTMVSAILPLFYACRQLFGIHQVPVLGFLMLAIAILYVSNIKVPKLDVKITTGLVAVGAAFVLLMIRFRH